MRKLLFVAAILFFTGAAYGQTINEGGVIGFHAWNIKLNPDVTMNQVLEFWGNTAVPLMKETIPEQTPFLLKGIGPDNKYEYASIYYYNSIEDLRKYWNEDGTPTAKGAAAMLSYGPLMSELAKFGELTYTAKDWIIIK
jgi:hypothetical protein